MKGSQAFIRIYYFIQFFYYYPQLLHHSPSNTPIFFFNLILPAASLVRSECSIPQSIFQTLSNFPWALSRMIAIIFLRFCINKRLLLFEMGNVCEIDSECLQQSATRDSIRTRSLSDSKENLSIKSLIQIKKSQITDEYRLEGVIGQGSYGNVYRAFHRSTKVTRAVKRIEKRKKSLQSLQEYMLLKKLDHPSIIRIYDIYAEKKYIYIVMDLCEGGELFDRIIKQGNLTENEARFYLKQLLSAIQHCHANNIMHRDLKPENIMFLNENERDLKIIDFGVGTAFNEEKSKTLKVGSIYYMAPEVIKKKYNQKCDVWSLGIILYILLSGVPPFAAKTDKEIYELILKGAIPFPEKKWKNISTAAKDLIQKMLTSDPVARISAKEALNHPWIKLQTEKGNDKLYFGNQLGSIKKFCEMNHFQSAIMVYISHNFIQNELLSDLESKFRMIDINGDGKISWKEFHDCYLENMPPLLESEISEIFDRLDKNHSGFIDYSEFITSTMDKNYIANENLVEKAFSMIDKDNNGYLSKQEMMEAFGGCNEDAYKEILKEFNLNNDGRISKYEFKLAMKGFLKK